MGESLAIAGAGLVDGALVAVEEDAAGLAALEDHFAAGAFHGVLPDKLGGLDAEESGEMFDVAFGEFDFGDAAAFGALAAVDLIVDFFRGAAELALDPLAGFEVLAKAQIFLAVFFAEAADLHEIGDHTFIIAAKRTGR